jgi:hypothetical protein
MIPVPANSNARDITRWLTHVFLAKLTPDAEPVPMLFGAVDPEATYVLATPLRRGLSVPGHVRLSPSQCYAHIPLLGAFNVPGTRYAVHLSRKTAKHWTRSLCREAVRARSFLPEVTVREIIGSETSVRLPYIHDPYMTPEQAVESIRGGSRDSTAITRHIAVSATPAPGKVALYVQGMWAGCIMDNRVDLHGLGHRWPLIRKVMGDTYVYAT